MSLADKLPIDVCRHIYDFDKTYRDVLKESLYFIEHAVPVCTCSGLKIKNFGNWKTGSTWQCT